jgi:hypothetical protein
MHERRFPAFIAPRAAVFCARWPRTGAGTHPTLLPCRRHEGLGRQSRDDGPGVPTAWAPVGGNTAAAWQGTAGRARVGVCLRAARRWRNPLWKSNARADPERPFRRASFNPRIRRGRDGPGPRRPRRAGRRGEVLTVSRSRSSPVARPRSPVRAHRRLPVPGFPFALIAGCPSPVSCSRSSPVARPRFPVRAHRRLPVPGLLFALIAGCPSPVSRSRSSPVARPRFPVRAHRRLPVPGFPFALIAGFPSPVSRSRSLPVARPRFPVRAHRRLPVPGLLFALVAGCPSPVSCSRLSPPLVAPPPPSVLCVGLLEVTDSS